MRTDVPLHAFADGLAFEVLRLRAEVAELRARMDCATERADSDEPIIIKIALYPA